MAPRHRHQGAAQRGVTDVPAPAGRAHDRITDGQTEAGPGAALGGAVEPVEQARPFGLTDAGAAVLHDEADPAALSPDPAPDLPVRARRPAGAVHPGGGASRPDTRPPRAGWTRPHRLPP